MKDSSTLPWICMCAGACLTSMLALWQSPRTVSPSCSLQWVHLLESCLSNCGRLHWHSTANKSTVGQHAVGANMAGRKTAPSQLQSVS